MLVDMVLYNGLMPRVPHILMDVVFCDGRMPRARPMSHHHLSYRVTCGIHVESTLRHHR